MASQMASRTNPLADVANIVSSLSPIFLGSGKTTTKGNTLDAGSIAALQKMLAPGGTYGKGAAVTDSNAAITNAMKLLMQESAPGISSRANASGGYNSSTQALETNDLTARVAGEGAQLQLQNIGNYAGIQNQAAQTLKGAVVNETQKTDPIIDPMMAIGGLAGATLLSNLFSSGGGTSNGKKGNIISSDAATVAPTTTPFTVPTFLSSLPAEVVSGMKASTTGPGGEQTTGGIDQLLGVLQNTGISTAVSGIGSVLSNIGTGVMDLFTGGSGSSSSSSGESSSSGCFITTAVCRSAHKPDDCHELTTLRNFRDTYMQETEERQWLVNMYYREAPAICAKIGAMKEATRLTLYKAFEDDFIVPAVHAIEEGRNDDALNIYRALFEAAKEIASYKGE